MRDEALASLKERNPATFRYDLTTRKQGGLELDCGGSVDVLVEPMLPKPHVLICGGGHIGLELARLCAPLDYEFSILDDRPEYAAAGRFPAAAGAHAASPKDFFDSADLRRYTHVVICGYSPHVEADALHEVLRRGFGGYVGLIGSKAKKKSIWDDLASRGIGREALDRVEIPIGLPIEAETPAEIAVSIMGSIIRSHRHGR